MDFLIIAKDKTTLAELQNRLSQLHTDDVYLSSLEAFTALGLLDSFHPTQLPDCILVDIDQGEISGAKVIERLRSRESLQQMPIVALLPKSLPQDKIVNIVNNAREYRCLILRHPLPLTSVAQMVQKLVNFKNNKLTN